MTCENFPELPRTRKNVTSIHVSCAVEYDFSGTYIPIVDDSYYLLGGLLSPNIEDYVRVERGNTEDV